MPFLGTLGGSQEASGFGSYYPGGGPIDNSGSSASGSLGTTTVNSGYTQNSPSTYETQINAVGSSSVSGQRSTFDPFNYGPITYTISSGSLPPGFSLNSSNGTISGSYTAGSSGTGSVNIDATVYSFTVTATNNAPIAESTSRSYTITLSVPYIYQYVIARTYQVVGYQNGALWSNINVCPHATNTCSNLGDGSIWTATHYKAGGQGDTYGYIVGAGTADQYNTTQKYNLSTQSNLSTTTAPGFGVDYGGCCNNMTYPRNQMYYTGGGTSGFLCLNMSNDSYSTIGTFANDHVSAAYGQYIGVFWSNGSGNRRITYSNQSVQGANGTYGSYGQQKGMSGKTGYGYAGSSGSYNGGYSFNKINLASTSDSYVTTGNKQVQNTGEENLGTGQAYGYMIANYNGSQNNLSGVYNYSTDVGTEIDGNLQPQGHGGASSGLCWHRI